MSLSDTEGNEVVWVPPKRLETDVCNEGLNVCDGCFSLYQSHMPYMVVNAAVF